MLCNHAGPSSSLSMAIVEAHPATTQKSPTGMSHVILTRGEPRLGRCKHRPTQRRWQLNRSEELLRIEIAFPGFVNDS